MKKEFYPFILILFMISCETEELNNDNQVVGKEGLILKRGGNNTAVLSLSDHKDLLARNSFIVGEMMRLDANHRQHVINSLDPVTQVVSMQTLLNTSSGSSFYDHYLFIARYASMNFDGCTSLNRDINPEGGNPWPPLNPRTPFDPRPSSTNPTFTVLETLAFINEILNNNIEIVVYNPLSTGNIYTVGHPLNVQNTNLGCMIIDSPSLRYVGNGIDLNVCGKYSEPASVNASNRAANQVVVLSRPNLSKGNRYPYINFNITSYLDNSPPDEIPGF
ncbi:hypothetical protein LY01_01548 [Nonlabens xylanidelens]|uniref:Uncharacterized protein n=1 Tax=Nonlabens xylanidelens TaxID=191564 RepID=A0A2S6IKU5_9FLAO|nr:hypothetical protein [Nonlabens xylanidelens]PPK94796.1 hypothetical protein LY01_01548 [Nonlabens xylanidelens]PQJ17356.1 hypothetical protein BST94_09830 [Nonlabens xylanidelens]